MSALTPCPECQRHVRRTETQCPFCGEAVSLGHVPMPVLPRKRLGRAATFAFGATVAGATAIAACDDSGNVAPPYGLPPTGGHSSAGSAVYGAPPSGSATGGNNSSTGGSAVGGNNSSTGGSSTGGTNNADAGAGTAVYGAPAAGAGGEELGGAAGAGGDGGATFGGPQTLYGGPPR
jgi:hypothetical protein